MNLSQAFDILQKEHTIFQYPLEIILGLIIIAFLYFAARKIAEKSGEDIYGYLKNRIFNRNKIETASPAESPIHPPLPPKEPKALCFLSASLPPRNPNFTGRDEILQSIRAALTSKQPRRKRRILSGLGGKGKSQIALEYAYRYRSDYRLIWWLPSEEPAALKASYADLYRQLDLPEKDIQDLSAAVAAVKAWLEENSGWLIIFDNALEPKDIDPYIPASGEGQVIITSRNPVWGSPKEVIAVDVFVKEESVQFLLKRTARNDADEAAALAEELGHLPLALEQAGAYIEQTKISFADYLKIYKKEKTNLLERGKPANYPDTVATTWQVSIKAAQQMVPESADLLNLLAFLSPEKLPRSQFLESADKMPEPLRSVLKDPLNANDTIAALFHFSMINASDDTISVHRLVQEITRAGLVLDLKRHWSEAAVQVMDYLFPAYSDDMKTWAICEIWLPHALTALKHAEELDLETETTIILLNETGRHLKRLAQFEMAKKNHQDALKIAVKIKGPEHSDVATCANNLGGVLDDMGDLKGAKELFERALAIGEKAYGPDHPQVAIYTNNLGNVLRSLGDLKRAKMCYERALIISRKWLGDDHPKTKLVQSNLNSLEKKN
jgi:tetratricopeptide (TPR) repeat protein